MYPSKLPPGIGPGCGRGAVAAHHAQAQGTAPSIRQDVDLGAEAVPAATESGIGLSVFGRARRAHVRAPDRAVQPHGGQIWIGLQVGHQARPDTPVTPVGVAAIDQVPLAVRGRQLALRNTHPCNDLAESKHPHSPIYPRLRRAQYNPLISDLRKLIVRLAYIFPFLYLFGNRSTLLCIVIR